MIVAIGQDKRRAPPGLFVAGGSIKIHPDKLAGVQRLRVSAAWHSHHR